MVYLYTCCGTFTSWWFQHTDAFEMSSTIIALDALLSPLQHQLRLPLLTAYVSCAVSKCKTIPANYPAVIFSISGAYEAGWKDNRLVQHVADR